MFNSIYGCCEPNKYIKKNNKIYKHTVIDSYFKIIIV